MSKLTAQSYKVKVDMIVERESIMSKSQLNNPAWFPNYLVLRHPVAIETSNTEGNWQGFVKEIENNFERSLAKVHQR
jgi:hypothetical protein